MEYINDIRSIASDIFLTIPLLLVGFIFFMGAMTSNVGLLYLFAGHLLAVPALSFLSNERGPMFNEGYQFSAAKLIKWLFSVSGVLYVLIKSLDGNPLNYLSFLIVIVPAVGQLYFHKQNIEKDPAKEATVFDFFNPIAWGWVSNFGPLPIKTDSAAACAMVPGADKGYSNPTNWMVHLTFFFGFLMANAAAIMHEPIPKVSGDATEGQQEMVDSRVSNRMTLVISIITFSTLIFITLIAFRYTTTKCEGPFIYNLIPLTIIGATGAAWFHLFYTSCGLRPTDILGVVQGMVSPKMADNPIICVGS